MYNVPAGYEPPEAESTGTLESLVEPLVRLRTQLASLLVQFRRCRGVIDPAFPFLYVRYTPYYYCGYFLAARVVGVCIERWLAVCAALGAAIFFCGARVCFVYCRDEIDFIGAVVKRFLYIPYCSKQTRRAL